MVHVCHALRNLLADIPFCLLSLIFGQHRFYCSIFALFHSSEGFSNINDSPWIILNFFLNCFVPTLPYSPHGHRPHDFLLLYNVFKKQKRDFLEISLTSNRVFQLVSEMQFPLFGYTCSTLSWMWIVILRFHHTQHIEHPCNECSCTQRKMPKISMPLFYIMGLFHLFLYKTFVLNSLVDSR